MASGQESLGYTYKVDRTVSGKPGLKKVVFVVTVFDQNANIIKVVKSRSLGQNGRDDAYLDKLYKDLVAEFGRMEEKDPNVVENGNTEPELEDEYSPVSWVTENLPDGQVKGVAGFRVGNDVVSIEMYGEDESSAFKAVMSEVPKRFGETRKSIYEGSGTELR